MNHHRLLRHAPPFPQPINRFIQSLSTGLHRRSTHAASEIASIVAHEGFWSLQAPIIKVASLQVNVPYSPALEPLVYPTPQRVAEAVRETLG